MDKKQIKKMKSVFDDLAERTEDGVEFWYARDLMSNLGYQQWRNFENAISNAISACENGGNRALDHFAEVSKMVTIGSGANRYVKDYMLTRYACYLIAQNGDPRKEEIAFAQSYFAIQTRKQELIEERIAYVKENRPLADFLPTLTIAAKNLATEMTNYNVEEKDLQGEMPITDEHVQNNKTVRKMLGERGIVPENLPPAEDIKKLERRVKSQEKKIPKDTGVFSEE